MNAEEKWQAVCRCDANYDGIFWYGVRSTGIFCNPSCKSRRPKKDNIVYFDSPQEALDAGYRACKRCRPDLQSYDPNGCLISHMKEILDYHADDPQKLQEALNQLPMTPHHFNQLFKNRYGLTPHAYVLNKRLEKAASMLKASSQSVLDIAMAAGFGSISSFYASFRRVYGMSPARYREGHLHHPFYR